MSVHGFPRARQNEGARLLRFLTRIVELVPRLPASIEAGHVEASQKVGQRRLADGRKAELWLVAKAPKRDRASLFRGRD